MILNRIKLINFRQYYDVVEIKFATSESKNVTVIHAENGVGKTALLNAIKWCFYETFTNNFRNPKDLVNFEAAKEGKKTCSVEIEFEEDGEVFLIIRHFNSDDRTSKLSMLKEEGGVWGAKLPNPELVLNSMLPREMADYFFFQGEGSNAVEAGNKGPNLANSIRDILGFKVANSLSDYLKKQLKEVERDISKLDTTGKAAEVQNLIEKKESAIEEKKARRLEIRALIPELKSRYNDADKKLSEIKNVNLESLRVRERALLSELTQLNNRKKRLNSDLLKCVADYGWAVFGSLFSKESLDFIDESQLKGRLPEPYNKTFIDEIIEKGVCICGAEICNGTEAHKRINEMLDKAANPVLQNRLIGIRYQLRDIQNLNDSAESYITKTIKDYEEVNSSLDSKKKELESVQESISLIPEAEIAILQKAKQNLFSDINQQERIDSALQRDCELLANEVSQLRSDLVKFLPRPELMQALSLKAGFLRELNDYLVNHLNKIESSLKTYILGKVNSLLQKFSRHSYRIKADSETFTIRLIDNDGNNVGQGDGLNLLLNLTITAALIEFVDERKSVKDPLISTATTAPLVIDAPFGVLDDMYRNVVVSELPSHVRQVMFFVSTSQWRKDMDELVADRIGARYILILEEREPQGERKPDIFDIAGVEHIANVYDAERNRVVAREIC